MHLRAKRLDLTSPRSLSKGYWGLSFRPTYYKDLANRLWLLGEILKPNTSHTCQCIGQVLHIHIILLVKYTTCVVPLAKLHSSYSYTYLS